MPRNVWLLKRAETARCVPWYSPQGIARAWGRITFGALRCLAWWIGATAVMGLVCSAGTLRGAELLQRGADDLPPEPRWQRPATPDWLIDAEPFRARLYRGPYPGTIVLANGLVRRELRVGTITVTTALDDLTSDRALLRGIKPEALLTVNGKTLSVGGATGQPDYAYLAPAWIKQLRDVSDFQFTGAWMGQPIARLNWKQVRPAASATQWPPAGVYLRLDFQLKPERAPKFGLRRMRVSMPLRRLRRRPRSRCRCTTSCTMASPVCRNG